MKLIYLFLFFIFNVVITKFKCFCIARFIFYLIVLVISSVKFTHFYSYL